MNNCHDLAFEAAAHLCDTIDTLGKLCMERRRCKMSDNKYRRLMVELLDMSKLLTTYNSAPVDNPGESPGANN